jgi:hypothetical protein
MRSRRSPKGAELLLALAVAIAAIAGACARAPAARFPHRMHLVGLACGKPGQPECLKCNGCHRPHQLDREGKLPEAALCEDCHKGQTHALTALLTAPPERPFGKIHFDHDRHLGLPGVQGQCVRCHAGVIQDGAPSVPPMSECFTCHEHDQQWKAGECAPCHDARDLRRILPRTFLRHEGAFMRRHGTLALEQSRLCESCHAQSDCTDCHDVTQVMSIELRRPEKVDRDFVHRPDFISRHAIEAASQPSRCVRCHEPQTCDACHLERGVSGNHVAGRNPHPPGWVGTSAATRSFHGREARRDILACASCHDQGPATNCIRCHQVGGFGGNPHPGGWRSARSVNEQMCRYCHG